MVAPVVVTVEEDQHLVFEEAGHGADDTQRRSSVTTMFYIPSASGVGLLIEDGSIWFSTRQKIVQLQLQARQQRQSLKQKLPYQHSLVRHPPAEEALASHFDVWEKIGPDRPISGCCIHNNISSKVNNYVDINIVLVGTRAGKLHAHALRGSTVIWSGLALHDIGQPVQEILVLPESKEKEDEDGEESTGAERSATPPTTGAVALIGQHGKVQIVAWSLLPEKGEVTIKPQGITTVPYTTTLKGACYSDGHCIVLTDQQEVLASPVWADRHDGVNASRGRWSISQEWLCLKTPKLGALSSFATSGWFGLSFRGDLLCYDRSVTRLGVPFDICQTRREISDKLQLMDVTSNAIRTLDKKGQVADREIAKLNRIIHTLQRAAMETGRGSLSSIRSLAVVTGDTGELMHVDISTIVFPPSMVKVVGKKYFMRLRISSMLQMDWNDGWTLAWQFVPLRTACPTCQSLDPPTPSTGFFSMGSSTTLQGLSPGRTIQRDLEVELGSHEGVLLQLPLQFRLGLEYRIPLSSGDRAVYFPIDQVVLDHLHFAEPVVLEESLAPPQPRWSAEMQADTGVGPRHQCTCAHSSSLSKTRGDGHHEDDADGEKEYRWIEQSPDQRLYFLLDAPSLEDNKEEMGHDQTGTATTTTTIGFDNCLSMLLGDYISTPDRLAGMLMSAETAYMMIPSCGGAVAELRPSVESGKEGANSRMDGQQSGMVATKTSATATSSTSVPTSATARIQLALADVNVAANRERGRQWAAIAGDDRMHVCLTVSVAAAADPGVAERIKTHLVDALERRICELMMP
ncbi:hypothetical protein BGZ73_004395 [Actinomortierella ambigua]|nr:hypothetical protein BGZ73_004395 [Actinomortierella ambigua]